MMEVFHLLICREPALSFNLRLGRGVGSLGQEEVRHFTTGIDLAVWTLDSRLSDDGSWPLLIGLRPQDCEWSVAALKFEAPKVILGLYREWSLNC